MRIRPLLVAALALVAPMTADADDARQELLVFAAVSLSDVLQEIGSGYSAATGQPVKLSFAASSALARQIEAGAVADAFVSADQQWMDYLEQRGLLGPRTRREIAGNRLVLIAPADHPVSLTIDDHADFAGALGSGRLAVADPDIVPAGRYARAALEALHAWASVKDRLARAENVRAALAYVARGEAPLGIVYATDARIEPGVRIVGVFPASSHPPIRYPAAATRTAARGATAFLDYLGGREARATLARYGFVVEAN